MHVKESIWIGEKLRAVPDDELFPLLDVGSSTEGYRTIVQPHLEKYIYAPLRARGGKVWHADIKDASGVDLVGDLCDREFQQRLGALGVRSILITNILHHVVDRAALCEGVCASVAPGGLIIASGPYRYPKHRDPIDTLFRPDVAQLAACFPGTTLVDGGVIDSGNWREWRKEERGGRSLARALLRLTLPMYRPAKWWELARQSPYIFLHIKAVAVVLRKVA